ncbi:MAG: hypothetical protein ACRC4N_07165, partial [Gammaproteobacteria bacterium]
TKLKMDSLLFLIKKHKSASLHVISEIFLLLQCAAAGRTGTKFQAGKSHTHPGHPIHPQQILKPRTTIFFVWPSSLSHKSLNPSAGAAQNN